MLTRELCRSARKVLAVEIDRRPYGLLAEKKEANLHLVNADFFKLPKEAFAGYDILVSNIPYSLSSKTLEWLVGNRMEAVLCLQSEFVEHMLARQSTRKYSKLSVFTSLFFDVHSIAKVPASCFRPVPKVDSRIVRLLPKECDAGPDELRAITLLMSHKKKKVRNAVSDSRRQLGIGAERARELGDRLPHGNDKVFKLPPLELLAIARQIAMRDH
jgi:16S rRNA (adenine1518-N6/adenine1519-N6)-dimethyltransferase